MPRREKGPAKPLPPPLPPETRTVGQLVGESIRAYGANFWRALLLGVPAVAATIVGWTAPSGGARLATLPLVALLVSLSYVAGCGLVLGASLRSRSALVALVLAFAVFLPFPLLALLFLLPGLAWLALFGLAVPSALVEGYGFRRALGRGYRLARVDYVHVLGGLATLGLVVVISQFALDFVLREYANNTRLVADSLAALVMSPLLFLGGALLYVDQDARLRSRAKPRKERDADLPHADDADREGRPNTAREPGPAS